MKEREKLGSRIGFILLSAGCAIGCGNVWKFPWMTGQNGGAAFVLIYIICLVVMGLPALTMEFSLGRAAQASPVKMYQKLEKEDSKWHIHGYFAFIGNICLMAFYTVVAGWLMYYFVKFLTGSTENLGFVNMISNPSINVTFMIIAVALGFALLTFDLQGGLEKITKYMMFGLIFLMLILVIRSAFLKGGLAGYVFYLIPDFSKITPRVVVAAMNQAFFSLSIGIGSMAIFGSYIGRERSLLQESSYVIMLDTLVAIMAGLIIFPSCFAYNSEVGAGPALLFDTMATVFANMPAGRIWGSLFFLFMVFAAFSTELAVFENILACFREITGVNRVKGSIICAIIVFILALTTALGFSVLDFQPFGEGSSWLDFWDFIVSNNLLPLGALTISIFCTNDRFGWGWDSFVKEANSGEGIKVQSWMRPVFKYVVPVAIIVIYIIGIIDFQWR